MASPEFSEPNHLPPTFIPFAKAERFEREGFTGHIYVPSDSEFGFNALLIAVNGSHPKKRILEGNTRNYFIIDGHGTFTLNGETTPVKHADMFVIPAGSEYEYEGQMTLLEFNVSPDNSFGDERI